MSTREIIAALSGLTAAELQTLEQRIGELTSRGTGGAGDSAGGGLRAQRVAGRLVLAGERVIRQAEVEAILDEFP